MGAVLSPLAAWQNFYVIIGTAAATLTGLMFIVITLIVGLRVSVVSSGIATFNTPNIIHFGAALLVAALLSAPWPAFWMVSLLLAILGIAGVTYIIIVIQRARHMTTYQPVMEDWVWHSIFPFVSYTAFIIAALVLLGNPTPALFFIGGALVLLLFIGIHNAWDNVTYVVIGNFSSDSKPSDNKLPESKPLENKPGDL